MLFELKNAKIKEVLDTVSGTSSRGSWTKATVIVEHGDGAYTDTYPMQAFGEEKIQQAKELSGAQADVKFSVQGREYNGRWYADLRLQFVAPVTTAKAAPAPAPAPQPEDDPNADLPF